MSGDKALMTELKKTLSKQKSGQQVPDSLEGEVTEDGILGKFRELYEKLYNSAGTEEEVGRVKLKLSDMIKEDDSKEVNRVTGDIVQKACQRMKPGKTDVSESYTSDVFCNAPDSLFHALAAVFRSFLVNGTITLSILSCAFLPLYKGGHKKPDQFTTYRAIAGASQLLKLWDYVVLELWGGHLSTDTMQFGFKKHMSTTHCSWLVTEVCGHFLRRRSSVYVALMDCSMAFDKCLFSKLFNKLSSKLPAIVVRTLLWVYEEQKRCVKLRERRSTSFTLTNGTRQGSVLSPALWYVYLDDLLVEFRSLKLGCYVQGVWHGMAPSRSALQEMVSVCERYGEEHIMVFSTDPVPAKSKTKCILVCGKDRVASYPVPIQLGGRDLPWVETALHLGHTLHQNGKMHADAKIRQSIFIDRSVEVREQLHYADAADILRAQAVYCCDGYGAMLWQLDAEPAQQYFQAWNTSVKLVHQVPRSTYTYLVEGYLAGGETSLRNQVLARVPGVLISLLQSSSAEVRFLARVALADGGSVTSQNVRYVKKLTGLSPVQYGGNRLKSALSSQTVPTEQLWRLGLLSSLLSL